MGCSRQVLAVCSSAISSRLCGFFRCGASCFEGQCHGTVGGNHHEIRCTNKCVFLLSDTLALTICIGASSCDVFSRSHFFRAIIAIMLGVFLLVLYHAQDGSRYEFSSKVVCRW